jgi:hypothetical protein
LRYEEDALLFGSPAQTTAVHLDNPVPLIVPTRDALLASRTVVIKNRGQQPLRLRIGELSCDCATADLSKLSLQPHEAATFTVSIKVSEKTPKTETLKIATSDPLWPHIILPLLIRPYEAAAKLDVEPK